MKPIRRARHSLMFMGAGAVAAYFLDPESGPARRERLMEQVRSLTGDLGQMSGSGGGASDGSAQGAEDGESGSVRSAGTADAFSTGGSDESRSGPIDLATGRPVSDAPTGA